MGKKKNKIKNVWDLSPEEQQAQLAEFEEFERGDVDVMSLVKGSDLRGLNENGFSAGLESLIIKDQLGGERFGNHQPEFIDKKYEVNKVSDNHVDDKNTVVPEIKIKNDPKPFRRPVRCIGTIQTEMLKKLNRLIIDDGIAPTSISLDVALQEKIAPDDVDDVEIDDIFEEFQFYIMSLKHPSAIYEYDDFMNTDFWSFARVRNGMYDEDKFVFFTDLEYVYCYLIQDQEDIEYYSNGEYKPLNKKNINTREKLAILLSMAYTTGMMSQAFFSDDKEYVQRLFNDKEMNAQKAFHTEFTNTLSTHLVPYSETPGEDDIVELYDIREVQNDARKFMAYLSGDEYDTDEYEDDELEDEFSDLAEGMEMILKNMEENKNETPDTEKVEVEITETTTTEVKVEKKETPVKKESNDDLDNLTFDVVRKK